MKFTIYQPKTPSFRVDSDQVNYMGDDYKNLYESEIDSTNKSNNQILEELFEKFNMAKPHDFHGHSLSVGDIVILEEGEFYQAYICDSFGWNKINLI